MKKKPLSHAPRGTNPPQSHALYAEAQVRLQERLADVKRDFTRPCAWGLDPSPAPGSCDLVTTCLTLHRATDLSTTLNDIHHALAPDGLFLGVTFGARSLHELRKVLLDAEVELTDGANPRVNVFTSSDEIGRLLPSAGFHLPVVDIEPVTLIYPDLFALMAELRAYGLTNALPARSRRFAPRALFARAAVLYAQRFPGPSGGIAATAELVFLHGWKSTLT